jgi:hypothetical protein
LISPGLRQEPSYSPKRWLAIEWIGQPRSFHMLREKSKTQLQKTYENLGRMRASQSAPAMHIDFISKNYLPIHCAWHESYFCLFNLERFPK